MKNITQCSLETKHFDRKALASAIAMVLSVPMTVFADTFQVTEPLDDGTGLTSNTLSWAILQANTTSGSDTIELNTNVTFTGVMKRLIDSDITMNSDATTREINGNNQYRPLFIKSGHVHIKNVNIRNGLAKGGSTGTGGAGAGLGGGLFVYDGQLRLSNVSFDANQAVGGDINIPGKQGGGGMFGSSNYYGGGGLFGDAIGNFVNGGYGGYGNYQEPIIPSSLAQFGEGGSYQGGWEHGLGGFGGGGSYSYDHFGSHGGFGGGGGYVYNDYTPQFFGGNGGFGAGAGISSYGSANIGEAGFGGNGQHAAGLGGGLFIRSGQLLLENVTFNQNQASSSHGMAEGLGGGLFIQHTTTQSNGNNQGMPGQLSRVYGCSVQFLNNSAETDAGTPSNNDEFFDTANIRTSLMDTSISDICSNDQDIQVTGNNIEIVSGDDTPSLIDGTDFGEAVGPNFTKIVTYKINNIGSNGLVLTGLESVELSGLSSDHFTVYQQPINDMIPGNGSITFSIGFSPSQWITYNDTVIIRSSDNDEPVYTFDITGVGIPYGTDVIFETGFE